MEKDVDETVFDTDNTYYVKEGEYESPSKQSRLSLMSQDREQHSDFPISTFRSPPIDFSVSTQTSSNVSTPLSDMGETIAENTVSYVERAKDNQNGTNIARHVIAHEKIFDCNKIKKHRSAGALVAPFATDYSINFRIDNNHDNSVEWKQNQHLLASSIHPVLPPSSWHVRNDRNDFIDYVKNDIHDAPPPPGNIILSNAVKKKVEFYKILVVFLLYSDRSQVTRAFILR